MGYDQKQIDYFKQVALHQYTPLVMKDYNLSSGKEIIYLTNCISNIYKYLHNNSFNSVSIYLPLDSSSYLSSFTSANPVTYNSYENLTPLCCKDIVLEVKQNGNLDVSMDFILDINTVRKNSIIYRFEKATESEFIYGKTERIELIKNPGSDSYFCCPTYKELEVALEDYKTKIAMHSDECPHLKGVWTGKKKIFLKSAPEHTLRDSLTYFLKSVRGMEVRPEQVVDKSHPVDIKITWSLAHRLALIEIKWIGMSLKNGKMTGYKLKGAITRARNGAAQLANYLDENIKQAPTKTTKGYLVVFDARREKYDPKKFELSQQEGLKYLNEEITFDPEFHTIRTDFSKPVRFFMRPEV